jgi:hypothetical protein
VFAERRLIGGCGLREDGAVVRVAGLQRRKLLLPERVLVSGVQLLDGLALRKLFVHGLEALRGKLFLLLGVSLPVFQTAFPAFGSV